MVILISLISLTIYVDTIIYANEVEKSLIYNESASLNYAVCLKENEYITDVCIKENRSFVTNLIDHVDLELKYELNSSDLVNYSYNYAILVTATANEKGEASKILYTKEETLKDGARNITGTNQIVIDETLELDYQKWNNIITSFKKNYVLAIDSELVVKAVINVVGENEDIDEKISNTYTLSISMPLAELTVNISDDDNILKEENSIVKYKDKSSGYKKYYVMADILYVIDAIYLVFITITLIKFIPRKQYYRKKVSKILKNYDDLIVTVKKMPDLKNLNVIEVNNFNELLNARETLNKPIIYFETAHKDSSSFIITSEKYAYLFVINAYDKVEHASKNT